MNLKNVTMVLGLFLSLSSLVACGVKNESTAAKKSPVGRVASTRVPSGQTVANGGALTSKQMGISIAFNSMSMIDILDGTVSFDLQVNGQKIQVSTYSPYGEDYFGYEVVSGLHTYIDSTCMNQDCDQYILSIMTFNESGSEGKQLAVLVDTRRNLNELIQQKFEASTAVSGSMLNLSDLVLKFYPMP